MGFAVIGTHSGGWTLLDGEVLPSDLADLGLEPDAPGPEYKRGPRSPRFARSAIPTAQEAEIANKLSRAASEVTVWEAFLAVARSMGMSEQDAAESFQALRPIPEPALSIACREVSRRREEPTGTYDYREDDPWHADCIIQANADREAVKP